MKIGIASDHAGFELKEDLKEFLEENGHEVTDFGADELNPEDDYPDFVIPAVRAVINGSVERSIVMGSSGVGEAIAANRIKGARAVAYYGHVDALENVSKVGDLKGLVHESREDNDTNVLSLGASFISVDDAKQTVQEWIQTTFTGVERHKRRIKKLDDLT